MSAGYRLPKPGDLVTRTGSTHYWVREVLVDPDGRPGFTVVKALSATSGKCFSLRLVDLYWVAEDGTCGERVVPWEIAFPPLGPARSATSEDLDLLRPLDALDRYGWRVRWIPDLHERSLVIDTHRLLLLDASVTVSQAESTLLRLLGKAASRG